MIRNRVRGGIELLVGQTRRISLYLFYVLLFLGTGLVILYYHTSIVTGAYKCIYGTQFLISLCSPKTRPCLQRTRDRSGEGFYTKLSFAHSKRLFFRYKKHTNYFNPR